MSLLYLEKLILSIQRKKKKKGLLMSAITHDSSSKSKSCWPLIKKTTNFTLIDFFFLKKIFGSSYLHFFFF